MAPQWSNTTDTPDEFQRWTLNSVINLILHGYYFQNKGNISVITQADFSKCCLILFFDKKTLNYHNLQNKEACLSTESDFKSIAMLKQPWPILHQTFIM